MDALNVSREAARRFLLESLGLGFGPSRVKHLTLQGRIGQLEAVQIDPVARVGRNQDLALLARDTRYRPQALDQLLARGQVFEYRANEASVMPIEDYPALAGSRRRNRIRLKPQLDRYPTVVQEIKAQLEKHGPLPSRAFASDKKVRGYWDTEVAATKETSHVLNLLYDAGELMVVKRDGTTRYFDLPERVVPPVIFSDAQRIGTAEADDLLFDKYFRAYRLIRRGHARLGWSSEAMAARRKRLDARIRDGRIVELTIDDVPGAYLIRAEDVERLQFWQDQPMRGWRRPIRFLPPLDNLLWDRERLVDLFGFYYRWEVYVPPDKRQFGIYAMPVLAGDRLVGRIDPEFRRQESQLIVHKAEWEPAVAATQGLNGAVDQALAQWAGRLGAERVMYEAAWGRAR